ncbi:MAG: prolyl oligopeptidase family serine peptidase [Candidatus Sumerlaeaceae bacterium]
MVNLFYIAFGLLATCASAAAAPLFAPDDDPREMAAYGTRSAASPKAVDLETTFAGQLPADPGVYDAQSTAAPNLSVASLRMIWRVPSGGVTTTTGIVIRGPGVGAISDYDLQYNGLDDTWLDSKDLLICTVGTRNLSYAPQADHVKLQITDVLRAIGTLQQLYPQYDRKRQYYFGSSGGGWLGLQLAFYCPEQFAEIHSHAGVMKLTSPADQQTSYPGDPVGGWNVNTTFPTQQGTLPDVQWNRIQAERDLRGPLTSMLNAQCVQRIFSTTATDPPRMLMSHGNADTVVDFYHFLSMRNALVQFAAQQLQVTATPEWGQVTTLGNWKFTEIFNYDHYFDRVFISAYTYPDCYTRRTATTPPGVLNYSSPASHGFVFHLTGTLLNATLLTESVTAAGDWERFY